MLVYINPQDIRNFLKFKKKKIAIQCGDLKLSDRHHDKKRYTGLIVDDQFIKAGKVLANCPHIKGMTQRYIEKLEWHETSYKQLHKTWYREINDGKHKNKSFKQFYENRLKTWDEIFNEIKTNGYRKSDLDQDNVEVAIDSHGNYLLIDGRHRVAFAQILGIKKIPVVANIISEKLAKSYFTENSTELSFNKDLAKALSDNKPNLSKQLDQEGIKDRLAIASMRD